MDTGRNEIQLRRLRLLSDVMEDYQENVRNVMRILELDLALETRQQQQQQRRFRYTQSGLNQYLPNYAARRTIPTLNSANESFINTYFTYFSNGEDEPAGFNNEEIAAATTEMTFDLSFTHVQCPITLDFFYLGQQVLRVNGCGHIFSTNAITEWFGRHRECPVCRRRPEIRTRASVAEHLANDPSLNPINRDNIIDPQSGLSSRTSQVNAVNTLLSSLAEGLTSALTTNSPYYEQELILNLRDFLPSTVTRGYDASGGLS